MRLILVLSILGSVTPGFSQERLSIIDLHMHDDLLAVLYRYPQVYVDIGVIDYTQPREAFYRFLQGITNAGFSHRVMFESDQIVWGASSGVPSAQ